MKAVPNQWGIHEDVYCAVSHVALLIAAHVNYKPCSLAVFAELRDQIQMSLQVPSLFCCIPVYLCTVIHSYRVCYSISHHVVSSIVKSS